MDTIPQIQISIYSLVLLIGAFQGVFFAVLLIFKDQRQRMINIHLAIILLDLGLQLFHLFLIESGYIHSVKHIVGFNLPIDIIVGVALYNYIRNITYPQSSHRANWSLLGYLLVPLSVLLTIPFWALDFELKLNLVSSGFSIKAWPTEAYYYLMALFILGGLSFTIYLALSVRLLVLHKSRIKQIFSYREKVTLNWLNNLLWLFGVGFVIASIFASVLDDVSKSLRMLEYTGIFTSCLVMYIGVMGLMQPRIYRRTERTYIEARNPHESEKDVEVLTPEKLKSLSELDNRVSTEEAGNKKSDSEVLNKYKKSALTDRDMQRIADKVDHLMKEDSRFLDAGLTMPKLAASVSVSPNYLSQTLNSKFEESFFDYINRQRVDYAKIQLSDQSRKHVSVLDIAMESAFNSKSAFYSAFKKYVGVTPVQFRQSQAA